jgi:hypothetical protein
MVKIIWTKRTFDQFERAIRYIREEHGLVYTKIVHAKIINSIGQLETHPFIGAREPYCYIRNSNTGILSCGVTRSFIGLIKKKS